MSTWRLFVPKRLVLADPARERLEEAAAGAADDVVAVGAPVERPGPGVSGRVHAERRSLEAGSPALARAGAADRLVPGEAGFVGAVMVRDTEVEARPDVVALGDGVAVCPVDGAVAHDPWAPTGPLVDAVAAGRPPFPCRPVVVFLGLEDDPDHSDAARGLVNGLLRNDVEARLAVPTVPEGLLLAEPAAPTEATLAALRPEVVVVLDPDAAAAAVRWTTGMRGTVMVELTRDIAMDVELVSWRIGAAQGRLRARIGPRTPARRAAELVNRLVAGPQPEPPTEAATATATPAPADRAGAAVSLGPTRGRAARTRRRAVLVHPASGPSRRTAGLAAHLVANDWEVTTGEARHVATPAVGADLVVGTSSTIAEVLDRTGEDRCRRAVVDLAPSELLSDPPEFDLATGTFGDGPPARLRPSSLEVLRRAGAAFGPSRPVVAAARAAGARSLLLPLLYPAGVFERLDAARRRVDGRGTPVVGWVLSGVRPDPAVLDAIARAAVGFLARGVRLDLVVPHAGGHDVATRLGDQGAAIAAHPAVRVLHGRQDPAVLAGWWAVLWAPGPGSVAWTGDASVLVEPAAAGVPGVAPAQAVGMDRGLLEPPCLITEPTSAGAWNAAVRPLLSAAGRDERGDRAQARAHALHGRLAGGSVVRRLGGWLDHAEVGT